LQPGVLVLAILDYARALNSKFIYITLWIPILATGLLAAGPWLPWNRQFSHRFSLRTLLLAATLVAVVLGLVMAMR
jgi:hypothetical protein